MKAKREMDLKKEKRNKKSSDGALLPAVLR